MRIVISGADGFLGSHVVEYLRKARVDEVVGLTLYPDKLRKQFSEWDGFTALRADISTMNRERCLDCSDVYLACAFPRAATGRDMAHGLDFVYGSTLMMLDKGCKAIINVSSQSVYDSQRKEPAKETDQVVLASSYAVAKYCVELSTAQLCHERHTPYTNIRMSSLIGPGFDQRFVNKMVHSAIALNSIQVSDNGSKYCFLDVKDAAEALSRIALRDSSEWSAIYNLGSNTAYTTSEIGRMVSAVSVELLERQIATTIVQSDGVSTNSEVDSGRLFELLHWAPTLSLKDSIRRIEAFELCRTGESI